MKRRKLIKKIIIFMYVIIFLIMNIQLKTAEATVTVTQLNEVFSLEGQATFKGNTVNLSMPANPDINNTYLLPNGNRHMAGHAVTQYVPKGVSWKIGGHGNFSNTAVSGKESVEYGFQISVPSISDPLGSGSISRYINFRIAKVGNARSQVSIGTSFAGDQFGTYLGSSANSIHLEYNATSHQFIFKVGNIVMTYSDVGIQGNDYKISVYAAKTWPPNAWPRYAANITMTFDYLTFMDWNPVFDDLVAFRRNENGGVGDQIVNGDTVMPGENIWIKSVVYNNNYSSQQIPATLYFVRGTNASYVRGNTYIGDTLNTSTNMVTGLSLTLLGKNNKQEVYYQVQVSPSAAIGSTVSITGRLEDNFFKNQIDRTLTLNVKIKDEEIHMPTYPRLVPYELDENGNFVSPNNDVAYENGNIYCQDSFVKVTGLLQNPRKEKVTLTMILTDQTDAFDYSAIQDFEFEPLESKVASLATADNENLLVTGKPGGYDSNGVYQDGTGVKIILGPNETIRYSYYIPVKQNEFGKPNVEGLNHITIRVDGWYGNRVSDDEDNKGYYIGFTVNSERYPIYIVDCDLCLTDETLIKSRGDYINYSYDSFGGIIPVVSSQTFTGDGYNVQYYQSSLESVVNPDAEEEEIETPQCDVTHDIESKTVVDEATKEEEVIYKTFGLDSAGDLDGTIVDTEKGAYDGTTLTTKIQYNGAITRTMADGKTKYIHYTRLGNGNFDEQQRKNIPRRTKGYNGAVSNDSKDSITVEIQGPIYCPYTLNLGADDEIRVSYAKGTVTTLDEMEYANGDYVLNYDSSSNTYDKDSGVELGKYLWFDETSKTLYVDGGMFTKKRNSHDYVHLKDTASDDNIGNNYTKKDTAVNHELIVMRDFDDDVDSETGDGKIGDKEELTIKNIKFSSQFSSALQDITPDAVSVGFDVTMKETSLKQQRVIFDNCYLSGNSKRNVNLITFEDNCTFSQIEFQTISSKVNNFRINEKNDNGEYVKVRAFPWIKDDNEIEDSDRAIIYKDSAQYSLVNSLELGFYLVEDNDRIIKIKSSSKEQTTAKNTDPSAGKTVDTGEAGKDEAMTSDKSTKLQLHPGEDSVNMTDLDTLALPEGIQIGAILWDINGKNIPIDNMSNSDKLKLLRQHLYAYTFSLDSDESPNYYVRGTAVTGNDNEGTKYDMDGTYSDYNLYGLEVSLNGVGKDNSYNATIYNKSKTTTGRYKALRTPYPVEHMVLSIPIETVDFVMTYNGNVHNREHSELISNPATIENYSYTASDILYDPDEPIGKGEVNTALKEYDIVPNRVITKYLGLKKKDNNTENGYILKNYDQVKEVINNTESIKPLLGLEAVARAWGYDGYDYEYYKDNYLNPDPNPEDETAQSIKGERIYDRMRLDEQSQYVSEDEDDTNDDGQFWFVIPRGNRLIRSETTADYEKGTYYVKPNVVTITVEKPWVNGKWVEDYYQFPYEASSNLSLAGYHEMMLKFEVIHGEVVSSFLNSK